MRRSFTIFLFIFSLVAFAQQTPIDFSNSSHTFTSFGGSTFVILPGPVDTNNDTGQFFRDASPGGQGNYIDLSNPIDLDVEDEITLRFYSFDPNTHNIVVKLENGANPDVEVSVTAPSNQNAWSDLTFDFATVGGTGQYSRLTIRIDDGSTVPGAFRIDDINDGSVPTDPHALDVIYNDLVWEDNFDSGNGTNPLDLSKWHHQTQVIIPGVGWANGEDQHYTNRLDNSFLRDGNLHIVAKRENYTSEGITMPFTSARLNSKFAFTHGRVDVRAKLPEGLGTWPAIWTLGKNVNEIGAWFQTQGFGTTAWPACGEIDIMEHGLHSVNETSSAIHTTAGSGGSAFTAFQSISDVSDNYHIYSVNWSPNQITFLVDNVGFLTYKPNPQTGNNWPFNLEQYIILNVAMGGFANGGNVDPSFMEGSMIIDYVRVYQNNALSTSDDNLENVRLYPNPSGGIVHIGTSSYIENIEVYNLYGQLVKVLNENTSSIDVSQLTPGLYVFKLTAEGKSISKKMVIN